MPESLQPAASSATGAHARDWPGHTCSVMYLEWGQQAELPQLLKEHSLHSSLQGSALPASACLPVQATVYESPGESWGTVPECSLAL